MIWLKKLFIYNYYEINSVIIINLFIEKVQLETILTLLILSSLDSKPK